MASNTLSGFSSFLSAARHSSCLASWISTSDADDVAVAKSGEDLDLAKEAGVEKAATNVALTSNTPKHKMNTRVMVRLNAGSVTNTSVLQRGRNFAHVVYLIAFKIL